jgi:predicted nucleic acid-binding protein
LLSDLKPEETKSAIEYLLKIHNELTVIATRDLAQETIKIAQTTKTPVYDALYIALTQKLNGTLYTADQKLYITANTITKTQLLKPT